ncbi:glycosyltransferase family 2 protein [Rhodoplanes sp. Z2-YC6860]|uniref:glycosyltransferase family 2 protein n=1 Tax=Rhodoplanes sp. Z2-YC6860 TaxID=674703 RepID=UPI00078CC553|nr:glycosyltransferase family A protein [Rhodoplanes sp. Z2-YC6860]AMN43639.1 glycosyl transferase family protein [Rhodoplanes sp. Z2-YC6860]
MSADGISVIIPAYNVDGFIADAFASIVSQTKPVDEILIVDDGSADGTAAWLRDTARNDQRLRVLTSNRLGPSGARNVGLTAATHSIIAFLDADDVWPRDKIERQMNRLSAEDRPDVVSGLVMRFRNLMPGTLSPVAEPDAEMINVNLGACLFHRRVFDTIGRFDERLLYCEDHDLMFRVREAGLKVAIMREVTLYYRIRPGSLTQGNSNDEERKQAALAALRLSIDRRRSAGRVLDLPPFASLVDE